MITSEPNVTRQGDHLVWGDLVYVAYFRVCELGTWPADRIASAVQVLNELVEAAIDSSREVGNHSSVYGRLIVVPRNVAMVLDTAVDVITAAAGHGLRLSAGVACGRVEPAHDLETKNVIGIAVNYAARLAHLKDGVGTLNVDEETFRDAVSAYARYADAFGQLETDLVKTTEVRFHRYNKLLTEQSAAPTTPPAAVYEAESGYVIVYDIEKFSHMTRREMVRAVEEANACARFALDAAGGNRPSESNNHIYYAPAGDGGVIVFRPSQRFGLRAAWTFMREFARRSTGSIRLRIGAAVGSIVIVGDALPVGPAVFAADRLSAFPATGGICVDRRFWKLLEEDDLTSGWTAKPCTEHSAGLLLSQPLQESLGPAPVSSSAVSRTSRVTAGTDSGEDAEPVGCILDVGSVISPSRQSTTAEVRFTLSNTTRKRIIVPVVTLEMLEAQPLVRSMGTVSGGPMTTTPLHVHIDPDTQETQLLSQLHQLEPGGIDAFLLRIDAEEGYSYRLCLAATWHFIGAEQQLMRCKPFEIHVPYHSLRGLSQLASLLAKTSAQSPSPEPGQK